MNSDMMELEEIRDRSKNIKFNGTAVSLDRMDPREELRAKR